VIFRVAPLPLEAYFEHLIFSLSGVLVNWIGPLEVAHPLEATSLLGLCYLCLPLKAAT
jgi:hypothetical protein